MKATIKTTLTPTTGTLTFAVLNGIGEDIKAGEQAEGHFYTGEVTTTDVDHGDTIEVLVMTQNNGQDATTSHTFAAAAGYEREINMHNGGMFVLAITVG